MNFWVKAETGNISVILPTCKNKVLTARMIEYCVHTAPHFNCFQLFISPWKVYLHWAETGHLIILCFKNLAFHLYLLVQIMQENKFFFFFLKRNALLLIKVWIAGFFSPVSQKKPSITHYSLFAKKMVEKVIKWLKGDSPDGRFSLK